MERSPLPEILRAPPGGRVLVFAPHADDEVFGCGGTLALHARGGDAVRVIVAFDGGGCARSSERASLVRARRAECLRGRTRLGEIDYVFWSEPEGHEPLAVDLERGARMALAEIAAFRPRIVYAPWTGEQHADHHALALAVEIALGWSSEGAAIEAWAYEVWTPLVAERVIDISSVVRAKARGLREHKSQVAHTPLVRAALGLAAQRALYLPEGARYGEAFRRIRLAASGRNAA